MTKINSAEVFRPSPNTDALDTLGAIHEFAEKRDAIHLAVEPVVAGMALLIGEDIGISEEDGLAYSVNVKLTGIVDPFLPKNRTVDKGQRFWLVVYPRQIRSLRHVWEHPDFPASEPDTIEHVTVLPTYSPTEEEILQAKKMVADPDVVAIEELAKGLDVTFEELMEIGDRHQNGEDVFYHPHDSGRWEGESMPMEFWDHYAALKGKERYQIKDEVYFSCSC